MKKVTPKLIIVIAILLVALVAYYAFMANKDKQAKQEASMTAIQEVLSRDMKYDYPATPKELVKYYNAILKCFYNEECTDGDIEELGVRARDLYDAELLEANEMGPYMIRLREDIADYKENERKIANFAVSASTNVDFFEEDGFSFARLMCTYNITESKESHFTKLVYLLRKDENNHWKIYGWQDANLLEENQ